ncbi:MAG: AAA family ATPase [Bdellovibrionales bacterium]|nr:AAA family ATPase [Bdellovibrionales bacterium]
MRGGRFLFVLCVLLGLNFQAANAADEPGIINKCLQALGGDKQVLPVPQEPAVAATSAETDSSARLAADKIAQVKSQDFTAEQIADSASRFQAYMQAMKLRLLERSDLIDLTALSLIAEEHILILGPPGNAKSLLSDEVLGHIVEASTGERSYYRVQMTPETTMSETHGPINPKEVLENGRIDRQYDQGILAHRLAFIDEIFDGRANAQRNILGILAERQHAQGGHIEKGLTETVVAATNKYIDEVYEKAGDDGPRALLDRFAFNAYVSGEFESSDSYRSLIQSAKMERPEVPELTFDDLDAIRSLVKQVAIPDSVADMLSLLSYRMKAEAEALEAASVAEYKKKLRNGEEPTPPYRSTKYHSPRTLYKAASMLKSIIVFDYITNGERPLVANFKDLQQLRSFFTLNGPSTEFVEDLLDRTSNPYERSQLNSILQEREMFDAAYDEIYAEVKDFVVSHAFSEYIKLGVQGISGMNEAKKEEVFQKLVVAIANVRVQRAQDESASKQSEMTGKQVGASAVYDALHEVLASSFPEEKVKLAYQEIEAATADILKEVEEKKRRRLENIENMKASISNMERDLLAFQGSLTEARKSMNPGTGSGLTDLYASGVERKHPLFSFLYPDGTVGSYDASQKVVYSQKLENGHLKLTEHGNLSNLANSTFNQINSVSAKSDNEIVVHTDRSDIVLNLSDKSSRTTWQDDENILRGFDSETGASVGLAVDRMAILHRASSEAEYVESELNEIRFNGTTYDKNSGYQVANFWSVWAHGQFETRLVGTKFYMIDKFNRKAARLDVESGVLEIEELHNYFSATNLFYLSGISESGEIITTSKDGDKWALWKWDWQAKKNVSVFELDHNLNLTGDSQVQLVDLNLDPDMSIAVATLRGEKDQPRFAIFDVEAGEVLDMGDAFKGDGNGVIVQFAAAGVPVGVSSYREDETQAHRYVIEVLAQPSEEIRALSQKITEQKDLIEQTQRELEELVGKPQQPREDDSSDEQVQ